MAGQEIWRQVPTLHCTASSFGRVRNLRTGCILRPGRQSHGYLAVSLWVNVGGPRKIRRNFLVHRLVCEAFHGAPPPGCECDHRNYIRDDNRPENLRWISTFDNKAHRRFSRGEAHGSAKLSAADVRTIRALFPTVSNTAIGRRFGVSRRTVADIRNGVTWK